MVYIPAPKNLLSNFLSDLRTSISSSGAKHIPTILEFIDDYIDLRIEFCPEQRLVFKLIKNLPLEDFEYDICDFWIKSGRMHGDLSHEGPRQEVCIEAGRRASKCLSKSSFINTIEFGMITGEELLEKLLTAQTPTLPTKSLEGITFPLKATVALEGPNNTAEAKGFYVKGLSATKRITSACGYKLEATPEHRIKVMTASGQIEWKYFSDLSVGDHACIHRATSIFPQTYVDCSTFIPTKTTYNNGYKVKQHEYPTNVTPNVGRLLGLLCANGSWTKTSALEINLHKYDLEYYRSVLAENNLLVEAVESFDRRSQFGAKLTTGSTVLRDFYNGLGFVLQSTPSTKRVPWSIRQSPRDVQAAFLSGLFTADGCCSKAGKDVSLSTASESLAAEVQLMLLNFGIVSRIEIREVNGKNYHFLFLRGQRSLKLFAKEITFGISRKQDRLIACLAKSSRDGGDTERIPNQQSWLHRIRESLPSNTGKQPGSHHGAGANLGKDYVAGKPQTRNLRAEFRAIAGNALKEGNKENLSSYRLDRIIEFASEHSNDLEAISHFKNLRECNYFYDPVVSVEDAEAYCVDLTVPGHEQYVAQGFTNHNTTIASVIGAYEFLCLILLGNPQEYYGIARSTTISILTVATTAEQGQRTIFGNLTSVLRTCSIIKNLEDSGKLFIGKTEVTYPELNLAIYSGNSKSGGQVGGTVKCFILEEAARFADADGVNNAEQLWSNLGLSTSTFKEQALKIAISSAWEDDDAIERLVASTAGKPGALGLKLRSWDLNPIHAARDSVIIASEYADRPVRAALEFEGIRPVTQDAFFEPDIVRAAFTGTSRLTARASLAIGLENRPSYVTLEVTDIEKARYRSVAHLDPSVLTDSYAVATGHNEFDLATGRQVIHIDALLVWEPRPGTQVFMSDVQRVLMDVHSHRPFRKITADHYAAAYETLQGFSMRGIETDTVYFSNAQQMAMYSLVRSLLKENRLVLPADSLWTPLLLRELLNLKLIKGTKVDHPSGPSGSKDVADAIAGVCHTLVTEANIDRSFTPSYFSERMRKPGKVVDPRLGVGLIDPRQMPVPNTTKRVGFSKKGYFRNPFSR